MPGRPASPLATLHGPSLTRRVRAVSKAAGLRGGLEAGERGKALHSLRHTFGSNAVTAGVAVQFVQAAMGHGRIETAQGYAKVRPAGLDAAFSSAAAATAAAAGAASAGTGAGTDAPGTGQT